MDKSKYFQCLSNESKKRHLFEISRIEIVDPYTLKRENLNFNAEDIISLYCKLIAFCTKSSNCRRTKML